MTTLLNPAPANAGILPAMRNVDILLPNETELALLSGSDDIKSGVKALLEYGAKRVVVTLGSRGCVYTDDGALFELPAFQVQAADTTAAGDTFCGALAVCLAQGSALRDALHYASAAAAISVTRFGAQQSIPYALEVEEFLNLNKLI
jgi:ribokinase